MEACNYRQRLAEILAQRKNILFLRACSIDSRIAVQECGLTLFVPLIRGALVSQVYYSLQVCTPFFPLRALVRGFHFGL
jgi:hypothetical protein